MSRGFGYIQRKVLQVLGQEPLLDARGVAAAIFGSGDPAAITQSQYSSVRRALGRLSQGRHVIDLGGFYVGGRHCYCPREEAFWILDGVYRSAGGTRAFWPHIEAAMFYGLERRRRKLAAIEQLRRLKLYQWRHDFAFVS